ncbi:MAG: hypothetical protein Aurels2KO_41830 [Aureliella sp.]
MWTKAFTFFILSLALITTTSASDFAANYQVYCKSSYVPDVHHARLALVDDHVNEAWPRRKTGITWISPFGPPGERRPLKPSSKKDVFVVEATTPALEKLLLDRQKLELRMIVNPILATEQQLRSSALEHSDH